MTRWEIDRECSRLLGLMAEGTATEADVQRYRGLCMDLMAMYIKPGLTSPRRIKDTQRPL